MLFWLEKIQSFARLNEWKEKEKSKWLTKVHLRARLNFAFCLLISTINFIKFAQLLRQVRVLLNSQEIVGDAFVGAFPVIFLSLWSKSVTTSVQTYRVKSLTALVFLSLWSFSRSFWTGQVIANFREIIRAPVAIACSITLSFTDQNLKGGVLKLN